MILRILQLLALGSVASAASAQPATEVEAVATTNLGTLQFEFFPRQSAKTRRAIHRAGAAGLLRWLPFHRAVLNGVIQGGDPLLKDAKTPRDLWEAG